MGRRSHDSDVLDTLKEFEFATPKMLAEKMDRHISWACRKLKALHEEGLVGFDERARIYWLAEDPDNGQRYRLALIAA